MIKYTISESLRSDIIVKRKELKIASQELSERVGMSKYWLPSVERGKASTTDFQVILDIYKILLNTDDEELIKLYLNNISIQNSNSSIDIPNDILNMSEDELNNNIYDSLNDLESVISDSTVNMNVECKCNLLSGINTLCNSFYDSPELASILINIPIYGVNHHNDIENNIAKNDLISLYNKYATLTKKNNKLKEISNSKKIDSFINDMWKTYIDNAGKSLLIIINDLYENIIKKDVIVNKLEIEQFYTVVIGNFKFVYNNNRIDDIFPPKGVVEDGNAFFEIIKKSIQFYNTICIEFELEALTISNSKLKVIEKYLKSIETIK